MHHLQEVFASAEGEKAFEDRLHALFAASDFAGAEAILAEQLATMESPVAELCRALGSNSVEVNGLEDVVDSIAEIEGEPVTTVMIIAANQPDLAFEKGMTHEPFLRAGLFTDEAFAFSQAEAAEIIAECDNEEGPAWAGADEDIELYLEIEGFGPLNTALLFHKQRHFFRDDNPAQAPLRYVEYVVGCWWRALRIQQAIKAEFDKHLRDTGVRAVVAVEDMRPELVSVLGNGGAAVLAEARSAVELASIDPASLIQRKVVEEEKELTGVDLRRRVLDSEQDAGVAEKPGFLGRLFGRGKVLEEAA